jgi:eukaryotic-like serine/threonine-protein kinase
MKKIGRYEVIEELGRGAMGVVYKASDPTIGRLVAIKLLVLSRPAQAGLPGAKDIFLREARAAGRLSHPGIVTIHDALEDPATRSCYIVMEFVEGRTLEKALLTGPVFPVERSLNLARQIGEALDYAHRNKIIHRDLKPANILLTEDGRAKITDFGIAKVIATEEAHRTLAIMGTPAYMSPEQVMGGELDASSDIFSLGILLYLMLTGEKPFSGDTAAVMFKIAYQDPAPPSQVRAELSKGHDFLLLRTLAKDKQKRYAGAREFLDDLDDLEHGRPPRSEAKVPMSELHAGDLTVRASKPLVPVQMAAPLPKHSITLRPAVYIPALAVLLVAGVWAFTHRNAPPPTAVPSAQTAGPVAPPQTAASPPAGAAKSPSEHPAANAVPPPIRSERTKATPSSKNNKGAATRTSPTANNSATPSAANAPAVPTPTPSAEDANVAKPKPPEPTSAPAQTSIQVNCHYELEEATLTVSGGGQSLLSVDLKGKKTGRFLGLKHRFAGVYATPIKVPSGVHDLLVQIKSKNGSVNIKKPIALAAPAGKQPTLHIDANSEKLELSW